MPLVRILVDGYSLLHAWPELAPGKARFSAGARDELIHVLRDYADAIGTPLTVVFDGAGPEPGVGIESNSSREMEIIYSKVGQTADDIIEKVAARLVEYGEVLVVTDDFAEQDTVRSVGARTSSCHHFIHEMNFTQGEFQKKLDSFNNAERKRYRKGGN